MRKYHKFPKKIPKKTNFVHKANQIYFQGRETPKFNKKFTETGKTAKSKLKSII